MKYEILPDHRLRIYCDSSEQRELRDTKEAENTYAIENGMQPTSFNSDQEYGELDSLISNSELCWIPEGSTGDLTSAPMLGIMGEPICRAITVWPECFGWITVSNDLDSPIIARWCYMNYQVRSFLDDLAERGECFWEGGYAEGMRPDAVDLAKPTKLKLSGNMLVIPIVDGECQAPKQLVN